MNRDQENQELQCRICAEYDEYDKMHEIFEKNSKINLQMKIKTYLYVSVTSKDKLPKMVCSTCVEKLNEIHCFAKMTHRAQKRLKTQFYGIYYTDVISDDSEDEEDQDDKEDQGFLKSILTKQELEYSDESLSTSQLMVDSTRLMDNEVSPSVTEEMEVKVDPMIFLQCGLDQPISPEMLDNNSDYDEKSHHIKNAAKSSKISSEKLSSDIIVRKFDCTICPNSFECSTSLQKHLWYHLSRPLSQDHQNTHREQSKKHKNLYSNNRITLQNYIVDENPAEFSANFTCPICNKRISTKGNLKVHLETHRPKGKYGCDICGRIFKTQSNLFRHKEYHGGIQFPCSVCGRVYPTNSTLRAHSITHSDLRPHACPLCDKTFKRNQDLKFHINQHTGARPYQCPYCPKAFASSGNCFSHRKRMHPKEVHRDRQRAADLMR